MDVNDESFKAEVLESKEPVVIDFWASWCGPCKMLAPVLEEASAEVPFKLVKINVDDGPQTASEHGIRAIPCLVFYKDGKEVDRMVGAMSKSDLVKWAQLCIANDKEADPASDALND